MPHRTRTPAQLVPPDRKRCKTCQEVKPLDAFPPSKRTTDGRIGTCRACKNAHNRAVYANRAKPAYQPSNRTTKRCPSCGLTKPIADFNRNRTRPDGYASSCRLCANAMHATYMATRRTTYSDPSYDPGAYYRRYKPRLSAYRDQWAARYPERKFAHKAVERALRSGRLTKPTACERCGTTGRLEGHHPDYTQPLQVIWLCVTCHRRQTASDRAARTIPQRV
jgi:hypothetical protein